MTLNSCKTMFRHTAKVTQQFLRLSTPDFIAADEWTSYSPELNPLLLHLRYPAGFGVRSEGRLLLANLQDLKEAIKKTNGRRSPFRQFENQLHNGKINECGYKAEWRRYSAHFPLIACDLILISCMRCVELIGYFVRFGHLLLLRISLPKQNRITS